MFLRVDEFGVFLVCLRVDLKVTKSRIIIIMRQGLLLKQNVWIVYGLLFNWGEEGGG